VDLKVVRAVRDVGVVRGATGPHTMECDDGRTYIVKFAGGSRAAVDELLGQTLARAVGLPAPRGSLVQVSEGLIAHSADMRNRGIAPGLHQGSELIPNSSDLSELVARHARLEEELVNWEVLPGTVCLDNWVLTEDRDRPENHLVQAVPGGFRYHMIDFTHSFTGPAWTADTIEQGSFLRVLVPALPEIAAAVRGRSSYEPTLARIERLPDASIEEVVAAIPPEWGVSEDERLALVGFLLTRRGLLREVLASNSREFPNWSA